MTINEAIEYLDDMKVKIKIPKAAVQARKNNEALDMAIKALEQTRWIPVSERLPENSGEYLVSVIDEYGINYKAIGIAWFAHKKDYYIKESEWRELGIDETVIAWMPLPEPYKPQESEDKE